MKSKPAAQMGPPGCFIRPTRTDTSVGTVCPLHNADAVVLLLVYLQLQKPCCVSVPPPVLLYFHCRKAPFLRNKPSFHTRVCRPCCPGESGPTGSTRAVLIGLTWVPNALGALPPQSSSLIVVWLFPHWWEGRLVFA